MVRSPRRRKKFVIRTHVPDLENFGKERAHDTKLVRHASLLPGIWS